MPTAQRPTGTQAQHCVASGDVARGWAFEERAARGPEAPLTSFHTRGSGCRRLGGQVGVGLSRKRGKLKARLGVVGRAWWELTSGYRDIYQTGGSASWGCTWRKLSSSSNGRFHPWMVCESPNTLQAHSPSFSLQSRYLFHPASSPPSTYWQFSTSRGAEQTPWATPRPSAPSPTGGVHRPTLPSPPGHLS